MNQSNGHPMRAKLNRIFRPLWLPGWDTAIITGGRASGKSHAVSQFLEHLSFEAGHIILFSRYTMISAHISVIPEFVDKIELNGHEAYFNVTKTEIINTQSGSRIIFRGMHTSSGNQTAKLKSIKGLSTFILDEAEEADVESDFDIIDYSIRTKNAKNRVILVLNPTIKESWIYQRWFEDAGVQPGWNGIKNRVLYLHSSYLNNKENLNEKFLLQAEHMRKTNPEKYNHIILGGWLNRAEGVIYTNWELGAFDESLPYGFGMDFGFALSPDALIKVAVNDKEKLVYAKEMMYSTGQSSDQVIERLGQLVNKKDTIVADSADPRLIYEIKSAGFNIRKTIKKSGSVIEGIKLLQGYKIICDPSSKNLVKELNYYAWHDKKAETPISDYDHLLDALRYKVQDFNKRVFFI